jgi:hypothetical protein
MIYLDTLELDGGDLRPAVRTIYFSARCFEAEERLLHLTMTETALLTFATWRPRPSTSAPCSHRCSDLKLEVPRSRLIRPRYRRGLIIRTGGSRSRMPCMGRV